MCNTILDYKKVIDFAQIREEESQIADESEIKESKQNDQSETIPHNSLLLLFNKSEISEKFEQFLKDGDLSQPVQFRLSYKRNTIIHHAQRSWDLGRFDRFLKEEIAGKEFEASENEVESHFNDGNSFKFPEDLTAQDIYIDKHGDMLSLEVMASSKSFDDLIHHNMDFKYIDRKEMDEMHAKRDRQILVIFEKDYDTETKNYQPEIRLNDILRVISKFGYMWN